MIFEVGEEYWITYGTTEETSHDSMKVLEVEGSWLRIEAKSLDPLINIAAPLYISARKRNRQVEEEARNAKGSLGGMSTAELEAIASSDLAD